jgi:hypothetical protein
MTTEQKNSNGYSGYQNIESKDICIAVCFYNPLGYKNSLSNIKTVLLELEKTNIPVYIIELIYPGQVASLPYSNVVVKAETVFFVKENLWNILEKHIPDRYTKIIFMDSDILCSDPKWIDKISDKLNKCKVVHGSEILHKDIYRDNIYEKVYTTEYTRHSVVKAIKNNHMFDFNDVHPGFNISIDRNFYHKINGFFEEAPGTSGDTLFWACFTEQNPYCAGFFCAPRFKETKQKYISYKENITKLSSIKDIDFLENNWCLHLYHGSIKKRNYGEQDKFIPGLYTITKNSYGVIEINIKHPHIKDMRKYFESRSEDEE